jgi:hypothetical protein
VLPDTYPGISFNSEGVCSFCQKTSKIEYEGAEALKDDILSHLEVCKDRNPKYDCLLGVSGGRDSSFLLYFLTKELGLNVLAYCADNGFIPEQAIKNIKNMTDILGVDLVMEKHECLEKCIKHHLQSWIKNPSPAMIGLLCTGCRYGIDVGRVNYCKDYNIPIMISGGTPFEGEGYKTKLMKLDPGSKKRSSFVMGYFLNILKNPVWMTNFYSMQMQFKEYYYHFNKKILSDDLKLISPFWEYIRWTEQEVTSTIENNLNWEKHPDIESTWRGDCDIALLKLYLYKSILGFNDKDDGLSDLIRDGQITREEALERLESEKVSDKVIKQILEELDLDFDELRKAIIRYKKTHNYS